MAGSMKLTVQGDLATVVMDRPPVNAQNSAFRQELITTFDAFTDRDDVRVAILTGTGTMFSAGADMKERPDPDHPGEDWHFNRLARECFNAIHECAKPVIAAVNGPALGARLGRVQSRWAGGCESRVGPVQSRWLARVANRVVGRLQSCVVGRVQSAWLAVVQSRGWPGANRRGGPVQSRGWPVQSRGGPVQSRGWPVQSRGWPVQSRARAEARYNLVMAGPRAGHLPPSDRAGTRLRDPIGIG